LGGVEGAAAEDDFFAGVDCAGDAAGGGGVGGAEGAGFVEVGAREVGDAGCFWFAAGFVIGVEEDAGDEGVCFQREGVACGDGVEDALSDLYGYGSVSFCKKRTTIDNY
jgi:hypothetical protein